MKGMTDAQISNLQEKLTQEHYNPNDVVIEEGETSSDVYFVAEGTVSVLKWDEEHFIQVVIEKLNKGETFGEIAFLDPSPRSTTVKAIKPTTVLKLTKEAISTETMGAILNTLYANIALVNANRIRILNSRYVKNLQIYQKLTEKRHNSGEIALYQYLILCLSVAIAAFLPETFRGYAPWLMAILPALFVMKAKNYHWSQIGISLRNYRSIILTSLIAVISAILIIYGIDYFLTYQLNGKVTAGWVKTINVESMSKMAISTWLFYAVYCFSFELVARGIIQTAIQDFFQDPTGMKSNFINAVFLFIFMLPLDWNIALSVFLISMPMGYFYRKQKTILGCFLIHFILLSLGLIKL